MIGQAFAKLHAALQRLDHRRFPLDVTDVWPADPGLFRPPITECDRGAMCCTSHSDPNTALLPRICFSTSHSPMVFVYAHMALHPMTVGVSVCVRVVFCSLPIFRFYCSFLQLK